MFSAGEVLCVRHRNARIVTLTSFVLVFVRVGAVCAFRACWFCVFRSCGFCLCFSCVLGLSVLFVRVGRVCVFLSCWVYLCFVFHWATKYMLFCWS